MFSALRRQSNQVSKLEPSAGSDAAGETKWVDEHHSREPSSVAELPVMQSEEKQGTEIDTKEAETGLIMTQGMLQGTLRIGSKFALDKSRKAKEVNSSGDYHDNAFCHNERERARDGKRFLAAEQHILTTILRGGTVETSSTIIDTDQNLFEADPGISEVCSEFRDRALEIFYRENHFLLVVKDFDIRPLLQWLKRAEGYRGAIEREVVEEPAFASGDHEARHKYMERYEDFIVDQNKFMGQDKPVVPVTIRLVGEP
jgi:hypothetical protein